MRWIPSLTRPNLAVLLASVVSITAAPLSAASHGVSERVQPLKREQRLQHVAPYEEMREDFPRPIIAHRPVLNQAYWGAWWLMDFNTEHRPGLPTIEPDYISAAYGTMAFSWDTSTMLLFARYGWRSRPTIVAMNNFYRNMAGTSEKARRVTPHRSFAHQLDFSNPDKVKRQGTPPQIMAWGEWEHYLMTGDKERLAYALPFLVENFYGIQDRLSWKKKLPPEELPYGRIHKGIEVK